MTAATLKTVAQIATLIKQGASDFRVRQTAIDIVLARNVRAKDYLGEIKAVFEWVQEHIRYTKDTFRVEVLHSARRMLELRAGDCDDHAILLGAMLEAIGHPVRLVITGPDPQRPELYSHVYLEVSHQGGWLALDSTMPHPMGWAPTTPVRRVIAIAQQTGGVPDTLELRGLTETAPPPEWLPQLVVAVRGQPMAAHDPRIERLWTLLRQRRLLSRSSWLRAFLRHVWKRGLTARPHPKTADKLLRRLSQWGLVPAASMTRVAGSRDQGG